MIFPSQVTGAPSPIFREQFFRDVTSLLITSHLVKRSLLAIRPECRFSPELLNIVDRMVKVSEGGEALLYPLLVEAGVQQPVTFDATSCSVVTDFFSQLPDDTSPRELAEAIAVNLRFVAQQVDIRARLAAQDAPVVGQDRLALALADWAAEWRACDQNLQVVVRRQRARTGLRRRRHLAPRTT